MFFKWLFVWKEIYVVYSILFYYLKLFVFNYMYSFWKVYSLLFMVKLDWYFLLICVYLLYWCEKLYYLIIVKDDISICKINDIKWISECSIILI